MGAAAEAAGEPLDKGKTLAIGCRRGGFQYKLLDKRETGAAVIGDEDRRVAEPERHPVRCYRVPQRLAAIRCLPWPCPHVSNRRRNIDQSERALAPLGE